MLKIYHYHERQKNTEETILHDSTVLILNFPSLMVIPCSCNSGPCSSEVNADITSDKVL